jgi:hypothetical protein
MNDPTQSPGDERRTRPRRYSDRRVALLLRVHEILFDHPPGPGRDRLVLEAVRDDFETNRALMARQGDGPRVVVAAACGEWREDPEGRTLSGPGLAALLDNHGAATGAMTLTYVRRPSAFAPEDWEHLFRHDLGEPTAALLSVEIRPRQAPGFLLVLQDTVASREWSSHDRSMAEEVAHLLSRAVDKAQDR